MTYCVLVNVFIRLSIYQFDIHTNRADRAVMNRHKQSYRFKEHDEASHPSRTMDTYAACYPPAHIPSTRISTPSF